MDGDWTRAMVADRLDLAADVMRSMPPVGPQGYVSAWPEYVSSFADQVEQEPRMKKPLPSPQAISRMEETLTWTAGLDPIDGKIVWMKAYGERWKSICWAVGLQRSAAHQHWLYGLSVISLRLNKRRFNSKLSKKHVIKLAGGA